MQETTNASLVNHQQVWSDSKVSSEEWSGEEDKDGEEDCKVDSCDLEDAQDGCKDHASDKSQTSDLGLLTCLMSISGSGDYQKNIACMTSSFLH